MGNYLACNTLKSLVNKESTPRHFAEHQEMSALVERVDHRDSKRTLDSSRLVDTYVMIAPDVERRHVVKAAGHKVPTSYVGPFHSGLEHLVGKVYNIYSRFDGALNISNIEKKPREALLSAGDALSFLVLRALGLPRTKSRPEVGKAVGLSPSPSRRAGQLRIYQRHRSSGTEDRSL